MAFVIETDTGGRVTVARSGEEDMPEIILGVDQSGHSGIHGMEIRLTPEQGRYLAESLSTQVQIVEARVARSA